MGFSNLDATNFAYVLGARCHDSTSTAPELSQGSWLGGIASNFNSASNGWESLNGCQSIKAATRSFPSFENDSSGGTVLVTYQSNMETIISSLAATSDGCIGVSFASNNAASLNGHFDTRAQMLRNLARSYGWSYFDMRDVYDYSSARATPNGYVSTRATRTVPATRRWSPSSTRS